MGQHIAFIGGGNMATALIGGLLRQGFASGDLTVVEPFAAARDALRSSLGVVAMEQPNANLAHAGLVVWAVKPQVFKEAASAVQPHTAEALHLQRCRRHPQRDHRAVAGQRTPSVRSMPNTPALIGKGITALYARHAVTPADRKWAGRVIGTTGKFLWLARGAT